MAIFETQIRSGKCVAEERKPTIESCTSTTQMDCTENSRQRPKDQVLHRSTQICSVHLALPARSYLNQLLTKKHEPKYSTLYIYLIQDNGGIK